MARTVTLDQLILRAFELRQDPDTGDIVGTWHYTVRSSADGTAVEKSAPVAFTAGEQTQIKAFLQTKLGQLKAAEGI